MKSVAHGKTTLAAEVTQVSAHGLWILLGDRELFAPYTAFPWFREGTIAQVTNVERPSPDHLYWPELDIDLAVDSLVHTEAYPLVSRAHPKSRASESSPASSQPGHGRRSPRRKR
jgi:hypothetical protein